MDRNQRIEIAKETKKILEEGRYVANDQETKQDILVTFKEVLEGAESSTIIHFIEEELNVQGDAVSPKLTNVYMCNETSIECMSRLAQDKDGSFGKIAVLNFANPKVPANGLMRGSWELEENLAAVTGILPCLSAVQSITFYEFNKKLSKPQPSKPKESVLLYTSILFSRPTFQFLGIIT